MSEGRMLGARFDDRSSKGPRTERIVAVANLAEHIAADANGPAAIPRRNGEPVFNEPGESRVFGMAVGFCERRFYDWELIPRTSDRRDFFG